MFKKFFQIINLSSKPKISHTDVMIHIPITNYKDDPAYFKEALKLYKGYENNEENPLLRKVASPDIQIKPRKN